MTKITKNITKDNSKEAITMSDMMENKMNAEELSAVTGGRTAQSYRVRPINPIWVRVTASSLNCRYYPNGPIAKVYERGHRLKVKGITTDGLWYQLWIYDPQGGECNGYIYKEYTRRV